MLNDETEFKFTAFKDLGQGTRSVHLDWYGNDTPEAIIEGYRDAAEKIITAVQSDSKHPDIYFWPTAFLYRHAFELSLKEIVSKGSELLNEKINKKDLLGHDLKVLWTHARILIVKIWPDGIKEELSPTETILMEFYAIDLKGDAFRYQTDKNGNMHLQNLPRTLSLEHMAKCADKILGFLDGVLGGINHYLAIPHE